MKLSLSAIILVFGLLLSGYASADNSLKTRYSDSELVQVMRNDGYSSVTKVRDGTIRVKIDGKSYYILNKADGDLQTYYAFTGMDISTADINEWNKTKRLSRAYLDSDNDPVIESDLLANAGMNDEHITIFFTVFRTSVDHFRDFLYARDKS